MAILNLPQYPLIQFLVDTVDLDYVRSGFLGVTSDGYITRGGRPLHRYILERKIGRPLTKFEITDHIDGDRKDNRRSNLRVCTRTQNLHNRMKMPHSKQPYKGVERIGPSWRARLVIDGRSFTVGRLATPEEAAYIYDQMAKQVFGAFARCNFL